MNISFAKLGVEECEKCDKHKIHMSENANVDGAESVRKKTRRNADVNENDKENSPPDATKSKRKEAESKVCGNTCDICTIYLKHIEEKQLSLSCYSADKEKAVTDKETVYLSCDLQKVILLPRLPGYKTCLFTSRLITFNMTFAPIGKKGKSHSHKPVGVLWHEAIAGRKDENITSTFRKIFTYPTYRDYKNWVFWADNCGGQNKCWTLFSMLVGAVHSVALGCDTVTIKYLTVGHTFMSADSFHKSVEREMKKMDKLYDFDDFVSCVGKAGETLLMQVGDFYQFESGLSESKESKTSRPLLRDVSVLQFRRGSFSMFFKVRHDDSNFTEANFLMKKFKKDVVNLPGSQENARGITSKKQKTILKEFGDLIPKNRRVFYNDITINEGVADLVITRE